MAATERMIAFVALVFAGLAGWEASRLQAWSPFEGPGPGLVPQILVALIGIAAIGVFATHRPGESEDMQPLLRSRGFIGYAAAMLFVALSLPHLGFIISGFITTLIILRAAENRPWRPSLLWSAALVLIITLIFGTALGVPFPSGHPERFLASLGLLKLG